MQNNNNTTNAPRPYSYWLCLTKVLMDLNACVSHCGVQSVSSDHWGQVWARLEWRGIEPHIGSVGVNSIAHLSLVLVVLWVGGRVVL